MRVRGAALALCALLGGCASIASLTAPNWSVYRTSRVDPTKPADDPAQFNKDRAYCQQVAEGWVAQVAASGVIISTGQGALSNSASLNPIAIGVGAVAGAAQSALAQSGLSIADEREQFLDCVQYWTDKDQSAYVPRQR